MKSESVNESCGAKKKRAVPKTIRAVGGLLCRARKPILGQLKQPSINVEEKIDRFVGRRTKTPDALSLAGSTKADAIAWRKAFGGVRIPRGVHRFKTHEEADKWLWQMIARPRN